MKMEWQAQEEREVNNWRLKETCFSVDLKASHHENQAAM